MISSEVSLAAPVNNNNIQHTSNNWRNHCIQLSLLIILLTMIALISDFASYLFSSKDRANIDVKVRLYHDCFTKITDRNNLSSKCLLTLSLHTTFFRSKLCKLSGALPGAPLCSKLLDAPR